MFNVVSLKNSCAVTHRYEKEFPHSPCPEPECPNPIAKRTDHPSQKAKRPTQQTSLVEGARNSVFLFVTFGRIFFPRANVRAIPLVIPYYPGSSDQQSRCCLHQESVRNRSPGWSTSFSPFCMASEIFVEKNRRTTDLADGLGQTLATDTGNG